MDFLSVQVREAKPVVNTKGIQTPAHIQQKLKKIQVTQLITMHSYMHLQTYTGKNNTF